MNFATAHTERISEVVVECQKWWNGNCLYLSAGARGAFHVAMQSALGHKDILALRVPQRDANFVMQNWHRIVAAGDAIVRGVDLPSLGEEEFKSISQATEAEQGAAGDARNARA